MFLQLMSFIFYLTKTILATKQAGMSVFEPEKGFSYTWHPKKLKLS